MGWNSGNDIFDPVAEALVETDADDVVLRHALSILIGVLQSEDWDTEYESLERFANYPPVVAAFREHGIILKCGWPDGGGPFCGLPRNHQGDHKEK